MRTTTLSAVITTIMVNSGRIIILRRRVPIFDLIPIHLSIRASLFSHGDSHLHRIQIRTNSSRHHLCTIRINSFNGKDNRDRSLIQINSSGRLHFTIKAKDSRILIKTNSFGHRDSHHNLMDSFGHNNGFGSVRRSQGTIVIGSKRNQDLLRNASGLRSFPTIYSLITWLLIIEANFTFTYLAIFWTGSFGKEILCLSLDYGQLIYYAFRRLIGFRILKKT